VQKLIEGDQVAGVSYAVYLVPSLYFSALSDMVGFLHAVSCLKLWLFANFYHFNNNVCFSAEIQYAMWQCCVY